MSSAAIRAKRRRARMTPQQRTQERTFYAKRRREALILILAPDLMCGACKRQVESPAELSVDHAHGKAWRAGKMSAHGRVARYWREFKAGIAMRALCGLCSDTDGAYRRSGRTLDEVAAEIEAVPF